MPLLNSMDSEVNDSFILQPLSDRSYNINETTPKCHFSKERLPCKIINFDCILSHNKDLPYSKKDYHSLYDFN